MLFRYIAVIGLFCSKKKPLYSYLSTCLPANITVCLANILERIKYNKITMVQGPSHEFIYGICFNQWVKDGLQTVGTKYGHV